MGRALLNVDNFLKNAKFYQQNTPVQAKMREILLNILQNIKRKQFDFVFEFGAHLDEFGALVRKNIEFNHFLSSDIFDYGLRFDDAKISSKIIDMNAFSPDFNADLIISNACLQWLDACKILPKLHKCLRRDGIFLFSTFGERNFWQVRELLGVGLDYFSADELKKIALKSGFEIFWLSEDEITLKFSCSIKLFKHIKSTGANAFKAPFLGKSTLQKCAQIYKNSLTYHPIFMALIKH